MSSSPSPLFLSGSTARGMAIVTVGVAAVMALRGWEVRVDERTASAVCLVPVELRVDGQTLLACATDSDLAFCGGLSPGDAVGLPGCHRIPSGCGRRRGRCVCDPGVDRGADR